MKRVILVLCSLLLLGGLSFGATYYIDATAGNDSWNGLAGAYVSGSTGPWKTIAKVNGSSFSAGDFIFLKRGEIWREQLTVPSSGTAGHPITFGAYGTGADPIISGADVLTGWTICTGSNLINNPSLETFTGTADDATNDDFNSWVETPATGGIIEAVTNADAYLVTRNIPDGTYACKMTKATSGIQTIKIQFSVAASTAYTLSYKGLSNGSGSIRCAIYYTGYTYLQNDGTWSATANWNLTALGISTANTTWTSKSIAFTTAGAGTLELYVNNYVNAGTVYIDNFSLTQNTMSSYQVSGVTTEPEKVVWNGTPLTADPGTTVNVGSNKWDWAADVLYVNVGEDPDGGTLLAYVRANSIALSGKDYITIDGIECIEWTERGTYGLNSDYTIIQNCTISGGGGTTPDIGIHLKETSGAMSGIDINNNTIETISTSETDAGDFMGIYLQGGSAASIADNDISTINVRAIVLLSGSTKNANCVIESNDINGCYGGIVNMQSDGTIIRNNKIRDGKSIGIGVSWYSDNCQVYYNQIYNIATKGTNLWNGIDITVGADNGTCYNNVVYKVFGNCFIIDDTVATSDGWVIKNNIFDGSQNGSGGGINAICWKLGGAAIAYTSDNNSFYPKSQTLGGVVDPTHHDLDGATFYTLAGWQAAKSKEASAISGNPLMTDPANGDFTLQVLSPCINAGTDVGLTEDYEGRRVPRGSAPDIGVYEYARFAAIVIMRMVLR